ncbi:MAG: hypothetical protein RBT45_05020 [Acholeplasmataceae bacterium]|jgi:predicted  nucleic acid-binding Zn-ribbon protein|nr:hypothetical protein [Acholeplasmataceae bacterium]
MSRWDNYLERIDEKVSKKEIEEALQNNNILIGCEFEFKIEDLNASSSSSDIQVEYSNAYDDYERYRREVRKWEIDSESYEDETLELVADKEKKQDAYDKLYDELVDFEAEETKLESDIENFTGALKGFEKQLSDIVKKIQKTKDSDEKDRLDIERIDTKDRITNIKVDISRLEKRLRSVESSIATWTKRTEKIQKEINDLDSQINWRNDEGRYEEVLAPYLDKHTYSDYFDYMVNWMGYRERDLYVEPGEEAEPPMEPGYDDEVDFETAIDNIGVLKSAPFKDFSVGQYGHLSPRPGSTKWAVENDSSLGEDGVEIKNPPMDLPVFVNKTLPDMFKWIDSIGYTDQDCGFHCHMSVKNPKSELDYLKLILFVDEGWVYKMFSDRAGSYYNKSVKDKLKTSGLIDRKDVEQLFNKKKMVMKVQMNTEHYDAIRLMDTKKGHVEFRYMGSKNYHKRYNDIKATIGLYAHNLALAVDPEYKRKEYILKLQRIFNKMELYMLYKKSDMIKFVMEDMKHNLSSIDIKVLQKMLKETDAGIKRLASIYKLDKQTSVALDSNSGFYSNIIEDIKKSIIINVSKEAQDRLKSAYQNIGKI